MREPEQGRVREKRKKEREQQQQQRSLRAKVCYVEWLLVCVCASLLLLTQASLNVVCCTNYNLWQQQQQPVQAEHVICHFMKWCVPFHTPAPLWRGLIGKVQQRRRHAHICLIYAHTHTRAYMHKYLIYILHVYRKSSHSNCRSSQEHPLAEHLSPHSPPLHSVGHPLLLFATNLLHKTTIHLHLHCNALEHCKVCDCCIPCAS